MLSGYAAYYFPLIFPTKHQRAERKTSAPWIPSMLLLASLQTLLKDMIKLSWPVSISSISIGTTGNKPSWSNVSTFIDRKPKLHKGKRQNIRKPYLVSKKLCGYLRNPFVSLFLFPLPHMQFLVVNTENSTLKTGFAHTFLAVFARKLFYALVVETCERFES